MAGKRKAREKESEGNEGGSMMEARLVDRDTYGSIQKKVKNIFNTASFCELNREKVDNIIYIIVYKGTSPRFGCIFGEAGNEWKCPFSAPFGYMEPLKKEQTVRNFEEALNAVESVAREAGCREISFTLPPAFYDNDVINTWYALMIGSGWCGQYVDISFAMNIGELADDYGKKIHYNARRNLRIAAESGLTIRECRTMEDQKEAYNLIRINREAKGYPLKMSKMQVLDTIKVIPAHMYIVSDGAENLASSLVYDVTDDVAQVIYWGDIPGCQDRKAVNFLGYELLKIYSERGFSYLDIGPSTEGGVPNYGLCDFKDSIGCGRTAKFQLHKEL